MNLVDYLDLNLVLPSVVVVVTSTAIVLSLYCVIQGIECYATQSDRFEDSDTESESDEESSSSSEDNSRFFGTERILDRINEAVDVSSRSSDPVGTFLETLAKTVYPGAGTQVDQIKNIFNKIKDLTIEGCQLRSVPTVLRCDTSKGCDPTKGSATPRGCNRGCTKDAKTCSLTCSTCPRPTFVCSTGCHWNNPDASSNSNSVCNNVLCPGKRSPSSSSSSSSSTSDSDLTLSNSNIFPISQKKNL